MEWFKRDDDTYVAETDRGTFTLDRVPGTSPSYRVRWEGAAAPIDGHEWGFAETAAEAMASAERAYERASAG